MYKNAITIAMMLLSGGIACAQSVSGAQSRPVAPASQPAVPGVPGIEMHMLPVQYAGRIMPLDSLARQMILEITGKRTWGDARPAAVLLSWTWQPEMWRNVPFVLVGDPALQRQLGLAADRKRFSVAELSAGGRLTDFLRQAQKRASQGESLAGPDAAVVRNAQQVAERLDVLKMIFADQVIRFIPPAKDKDAPWCVASQLDRQAGLDAAARDRIAAGWTLLRDLFGIRREQDFRTAAKGLTQELRAIGSPAWPDKEVLAREWVYNLARPFQKGWWATLTAVVLGLVSLGLTGRMYKACRLVAWGSLVNGLIALTIGLLLRWSFSGHAPVSNMYESLVFMGWGVVLLGIVMLLFTRVKAALPIVAIVATAILVVADTSPLDATASVLLPVLRNTMWLTFHVQTIMLAYSAFALTMGLGHVQAGKLAYRTEPAPVPDSLDRLLYGMTLVGCVFLTAGILFGAIWANESWGRYWYWDPKETWSLITLLGYMAVLHGRRAGWFGAFGLAMASVLCFLLVIMTYYGVNLLGKGLHTYGSVGGGLRWVLIYVTAELVFLAWMWGTHSRPRASRSAHPAASDSSAS